MDIRVLFRELMSSWTMCLASVPTPHQPIGMSLIYVVSMRSLPEMFWFNTILDVTVMTGLEPIFDSPT